MKFKTTNPLKLLTALILTLGLAGCISQKKVDAFAREYAADQVFTYQYSSRLVGAFSRQFSLVDLSDPVGGPAQPIAPGTRLDLTGYRKPAVKVQLSQPVFLKKKHGDRLRLVLHEQDIELSDGLVKDGVEDITLDQTTRVVSFPVNLDPAPREAFVKLKFRLLDEAGSEISAEGLDYELNFQFEPLD